MTPGRTPRWRVAAGALVLLLLAAVAVRVAPLYLHSLAFRHYVEETTRNVQNQTLPDDAVRIRILQKAESLDLPVKESNVQISHSPGGLRIDVQYAVRMELPLHALDLHFRTRAGSR